MDARNYIFGPWLGPDRGLRVTPTVQRPSPAFYRQIEGQRWWDSEGIPQGAVLVGDTPRGTSMGGIHSYHPGDDYYYGRVGNRVARQAASLLGAEDTHELGPTITDAHLLTRVDRDNSTPKYVCLGGSKLYFFEGEFASGTPIATLDFDDYGGARPSTGLSQLDADGYGRVWVTQHDADNSKQPWRVFFSEDFGQTWRVIFNANDIFAGEFAGTGHIHAVVYDPYDDLVFVLTGDLGMAQVFVSYDNGVNWFRLFDDGVIQFTEAMVFPEHIALGTDLYSPKGMVFVPRSMIKDRVFRGEPLKLHEVFVSHLWGTPGTQVPFFTVSNQQGARHIGHPLPSVTIVGTVATSSQTPGYYTPLYASKDGYNWFEIARLVGGHERIARVFGPDSQGIVLCGGSKSLAFRAPEWV